MIPQMTLDVISAVGTILVALGVFVVIVVVLGTLLALRELRGYRDE